MKIKIKKTQNIGSFLLVISSIFLCLMVESCKKEINEIIPFVNLSGSSSFSRKIELKWTAVEEKNVVYKIYRANASGSFENAIYQLIGESTTNTFEDKDVNTDQTYYYYIVVEINKIRAYPSNYAIGKTIPLTALESFTELGDQTGGVRYDAPNASSVPDVIIKILKENAIQNSDIVFLIDNTSSMSDDISAVKAGVAKIISSLPKDSRLGIATYNDHNTTSAWYKFIDLSTDFPMAITFLNSISVFGGGDYPESVYEGIYETASKMSWKGTKKIIIVIGDAPPLEGSLSKYTLKQVIDKCKEKSIDVNLYPILIAG